MTRKQFDEWAEFYEVEPWGFEVDDEHNAMIAMVTNRSMGGKSDMDTWRLRRYIEDALAESRMTEREKFAKLLGLPPPPK